MSSKKDDTVLTPLPSVRMAYTIDSRQPVRCTLIGEEPLFYLDAEISEFDDLDDLIDLDFLDLEQIEQIRSQNGASRTIEKNSATESVRDEISPEAITLFKAQFGPSAQKAQEATLETCRALIAQSRMGETLLNFAHTAGIQIVEGDQIQSVLYDRSNGIIRLRKNLNLVEKSMLMVREMRRLFQQKQGALINPLLFHPDHAVLVNRLQAADLMTHMVRVAWEIKLSGNPAPWAYLESNGYNDLTRVMAREAMADFRSLNNGRAMAATFEAWFISERCRAFDRTLIQQMLADYQSYVQSAGHVETSRILSHQMISALGTMTYGNNYLSAHASIILSDPIFTEIRDRSNANFLWFIKFEQSFRQTERDLQHKDGSTGKLSDTEKNRHGKDTATILHLSTARAHGDDHPKAGRGQGSRVVDLRTWRRDRPDKS